MTLILADYEEELITEHSPSWISFAKRRIFSYLQQSGIPTGTVTTGSDHLLFVGETSPYIQLAASNKRAFSILLFLSNPFHILSEMALLNVDTLYTINVEHAYLVRSWLDKRFGGTKDFKVHHWAYYPKTFEPTVRHRPLIGIVEPDFNSGDIFDNFYQALSSLLSAALYSTSYDYAFYCYHPETYARLNALNSKVPLYYLDDAKNSPLVDITIMPNALLSLDVFKYNPVLSSFAKRIPVLRPDWLTPSSAERTSLTLRSLNGADTAHRILDNFVNHLQMIEKLDTSSSIIDDLTRRAMLGDTYGDYRKFRRIE